MNKKVGLAIVTYTINYGTFLQAFATKAAVEGLGYDTEIINIDSVIEDVSKARKKYFMSRLFSISEVMSYKSTISSIIRKKTNEKYKTYMQKRENEFVKFQNKFFQPGPKCDSWQGLNQHCKEFSSVLVGSDQLWRPANIAGNFYTLNFVPDEINKISYATSFGLDEIRKNQKETVSSFLNRIQYLSCREASGVEIIKKLTGREAKLVCDPTLLLKKSEWERYINQEPLIKEDYILVYLLGNNKQHREYVKNLSQKTSCKVIGVLHGSGYIKGDEKFVDESPADVGPFEFLNLIKNAKYVCTDSFHGCVFSTIFERNYYVFKRFSDKNKMSTNSRVTGLLETLGLSDRVIENDRNVFLETINYERVNKKLEKFREYSIEYLKNALN